MRPDLKPMQRVLTQFGWGVVQETYEGLSRISVIRDGCPDLILRLAPYEVVVPEAGAIIRIINHPANFLSNASFFRPERLGGLADDPWPADEVRFFLHLDRNEYSHNTPFGLPQECRYVILIARADGWGVAVEKIGMKKCQDSSDVRRRLHDFKEGFRPREHVHFCTILDRVEKSIVWYDFFYQAGWADFNASFRRTR